MRWDFAFALVAVRSVKENAALPGSSSKQNNEAPPVSVMESSPCSGGGRWHGLKDKLSG
jgi:hypothetical protein